MVILPSRAEIEKLFPEFASKAQEVYDAWEQDEHGYDEELGAGGICHIIADKIVEVLNGHFDDIRATTRSLTSEQHVDVLIALQDGVFELDIPYRQYEFGGGFHWTKISNVSFTENFVSLEKIDGDPARFWQYTDEDACQFEDEDLLLVCRKLNPDYQVQTFWHASPHDIEEFHSFTHFGTKQSALDRAKTFDGEYYLYEVEIDINSTLKIRDGLGEQHSLVGLTEFLETRLSLPFSTVDDINIEFQKSSEQGRSLLAKILTEFGIDALEYENNHEDKGSVSILAVAPKIEILSKFFTANSKSIKPI